LAKSVTRTLRLDDDLDKSIQQEASEGNVSVNLLVNQLIRRHVDWESPFEKFGRVQIYAGLFKRLVEVADEETLQGFGRWMASEFYEPFGRYLFGELTFQTALLTFKRMAMYGGIYAFVYNSSDKRKYIIVLRHGSGNKYSAYFAGLLKGVYSDILKMDAKVEATKDLCLAQVSLVP
jgi:predicted transcriptional regulator